jgi:hypothetical protein
MGRATRASDLRLVKGGGKHLWVKFGVTRGDEPYWEEGIYVTAHCAKCGARQGVKSGKQGGTRRVWALKKVFPKWEFKTPPCTPLKVMS